MKHKPACSAMRPNTAPASPAEAVIIYFDKENHQWLLQNHSSMETATTSTDEKSKDKFWISQNVKTTQRVCIIGSM